MTYPLDEAMWINLELIIIPLSIVLYIEANILFIAVCIEPQDVALLLYPAPLISVCNKQFNAVMSLSISLA